LITVEGFVPLELSVQGVFAEEVAVSVDEDAERRRVTGGVAVYQGYG
jgi:hypothetical protein